MRFTILLLISLGLAAAAPTPTAAPSLPHYQEETTGLACTVPHCTTMYVLGKHMGTCNNGKECSYAHCSSSRSILRHWRNCQREECPVCQPVKINRAHGIASAFVQSSCKYSLHNDVSYKDIDQCIAEVEAMERTPLKESRTTEDPKGSVDPQMQQNQIEDAMKRAASAATAATVRMQGFEVSDLKIRNEELKQQLKLQSELAQKIQEDEQAQQLHKLALKKSRCEKADHQFEQLQTAFMQQAIRQAEVNQRLVKIQDENTQLQAAFIQLSNRNEDIIKQLVKLQDAKDAMVEHLIRLQNESAQNKVQNEETMEQLVKLQAAFEEQSIRNEEKLFKLQDENAQIYALVNAHEKQPGRNGNSENVAEETPEDLNRFRVWPCKLRLLEVATDFVPTEWMGKQIYLCKVLVEAGQLRNYTPIYAPSKKASLGEIDEIETSDGKKIKTAVQGDEVLINILASNKEFAVCGDLNVNELLVSKVTSESIDLCKECFKDDFSDEDWKLMDELKTMIENDEGEQALPDSKIDTSKTLADIYIAIVFLALCYVLMKFSFRYLL